MKKLINYQKLLKLFVLFIFCSTASISVAQRDVSQKEIEDNVDLTKLPNFEPYGTPIYSLGSYPKTRAKGVAAEEKRPTHVDNSRNRYFRPIFNQIGGSCTCASHIGYMFTYEIDAMRRVDASIYTNEYPTHFVWLMNGQGTSIPGLPQNCGVPNCEVYGGATYSKFFGSTQTWDSRDFGWMQGYDKWYEAMHNRIIKHGIFPVNLHYEEGRSALKNWLWNHNGDDYYDKGGVCTFSVAVFNTKVHTIASTPANDEAGVVGKKFIASWGEEINHSMTIAGYDDRIEFDLDGNGVAGEVDKDEVGAWIVVNSWGSGYEDEGRIYCPYKYAVRKGTDGGGSPDDWVGYYHPEVFFARKDYRPLRTMKVKMDFSRRSEISIKGGVSENLNAVAPDEVVTFQHFNYGGGGIANVDDVDCPMLGKWVDGWHNEPMEFGADLTDLSALVDTRQPLKYFLIIASKDTAQGTGHIYDASVIDYEFYKDGIETAFPISSPVEVKNMGKTTILSTIVLGEQMYPPLNLGHDGELLTWQVPQDCSYTLQKYYIYKDDILLDSVDADQLSYNMNDITGVYSVRAKYCNAQLSALSAASNKLSISNKEVRTPKRMVAHLFRNSGFLIPDIFTDKLIDFTIEFWINPNSVHNYNQQMGPGWAHFLAHTDEEGRFMIGWDTAVNGRITSAPKTLQPGLWTHIAASFNGGRLTLYVNGVATDSISTGYYGVGGFRDLWVGANGGDLDCKLEEFRVWKTARTATQIKDMMGHYISDAANNPDLLAYYPMEVITIDGVDYLEDFANGHNAKFNADGEHSSTYDISQHANGAAPLKADFSLVKDTFYVGTTVKCCNTSSETANKYKWISSDSPDDSLNVKDASFVFKTAGEKTITLTAYDEADNALSISKTITVLTLPDINAKFHVTKHAVAAGEPISFINETVAPGCIYEWLTPGANDQEVAYTTNCSACYDKFGTYTVTLKVHSGDKIFTYSDEITVSAVAPVTDFDVKPYSILLGEKAYLCDKSRFDPNSWKWTIESSKQCYNVDGQFSSVLLDRPGIYDVTLETSNEIGSSSRTDAKTLIVSNADAKTSLCFNTVKEQVVAAAPWNTAVSQFTIDFWLNPSSVYTHSVSMGEDHNTFDFYNHYSNCSCYINNEHAFSSNDYFIANEWHHYAIVFNEGTVKYYRDCEFFSGTSINSKTCPALSSFHIGDGIYGVNSHVDEFRIWQTALSLSELKAVANSPIEDVALAEEKQKLCLYYSFNQNSGDVIDATSNHNDGERINFGPDGDAWDNTLGVFTLNLKGEKKDITADYLTNYEVPFLRVEEGLDDYDNIHLLLQNDSTSTWKIKGQGVKDDIVKGFYVMGNGCTLYTKLVDGYFNDKLENYKLYQTIILPAGKYYFNVNTSINQNDNDCKLVVSKGDSLPDYEDIETAAIASTSMAESTEVSFILYEETEISLGLAISTDDNIRLLINSFQLLNKSMTTLEADDVNSIDTPMEVDEVKVKTSKSGITLKTARATDVRIISVSGVVVFHDIINGERQVVLPFGLYIVNRQKVIVR